MPCCFPSHLSRGAGLFLLVTVPLFAHKHHTPAVVIYASLSPNFKTEN